MQLSELFTNQLNERGSNKCEELFGQYLFGEYEKYHGSVKEPNTPFEQEAFDAFASWIESSGGKRRTNIKYLNQLIKCKEQFPTILDPGQDVYYRTFTFMKDAPILQRVRNLERLLVGRPENWKDTKLVGQYLHLVDCEIDYTPLSIMESWTNSKTSALKFATNGFVSTSVDRYDSATFVLKATLDQSEMLFNPKFTSKMGSDTRWGGQNEIIRLAPNKSPIKVRASYIPLLAMFGNFSQLGVPRDMKEYVRNTIKSKWQSF